jgi:hypothetical protein
MNQSGITYTALLIPSMQVPAKYGSYIRVAEQEPRHSSGSRQIGSSRPSIFLTLVSGRRLRNWGLAAPPNAYAFKLKPVKDGAKDVLSLPSRCNKRPSKGAYAVSPVEGL